MTFGLLKLFFHGKLLLKILILSTAFQIALNDYAVFAFRAAGHFYVLRSLPTGDPHPDNPNDAVLTPTQMVTLEGKYDDLVGNTGSIISDDNASNCWNPANGAYNTANNDSDCLSAYKFF